MSNNYSDQALRLTISNPQLCHEIVRLMQKHSYEERRMVRGKIGMTAKQKELLEFIVDFEKANGIPPSFDEMKDGVGLSSKSGVHRLIVALEERGFITRLPNRARAIAINNSELIKHANLPVVV